VQRASKVFYHCFREQFAGFQTIYQRISATLLCNRNRTRCGEFLFDGIAAGRSKACCLKKHTRICTYVLHLPLYRAKATMFLIHESITRFTPTATRGATTTMTNSSLTSAKIIPFPKGGRSSVGKGLESDKLNEATPISEALSGSWYHDEAIQEAKAAIWSPKH
jgi:hypothetical protein